MVNAIQTNKVSDINPSSDFEANALTTDECIEVTHNVAKKVMFSGRDTIFTHKGIQILFTASEGGRLQEKGPFIRIYFDVEGNKLTHPKLSKRSAPQNNGYFMRENRGGCVSDIIQSLDLEPIPQNRLEVLFHEMISQINVVDPPSVVNFKLESLKRFASEILKNEKSDYTELSIALKAVIFYKLYHDALRCLNYGVNETKSFCLYVANDIHQRLINLHPSELKSLNFIKPVLKEIKERNVVQEDEISVTRFNTLTAKFDFFILNSRDFEKNWDDIDDGTWDSGTRTMKSIQYTKHQLVCIQTLLLILRLDSIFNKILPRLI